MAKGDTSIALIYEDPDLRCSEALEAVYLSGSSIDGVAIADFLRQTPHLRILQYSHLITMKDDCQEWNICKFLAAIEREAGSHLEEVSLSIDQLPGSIAPGRASMRGFQHLQKLEFPLEIVIDNINQAISRVVSPGEGFTDHGLDKFKPFIGDFIPAPVSQLSLLSIGNDRDAKALEAMFRGFAAKKDSQLPALKEIQLRCHMGRSTDDAYNEQCAKLVTETEEAGVVLHLVNWAY